VDSLPAAGTVRRTVRVAVALVVGQALLVGLIGWLTFGRASGSGGAVDQLAARPATPLPPAATSRYAEPPRPPSTSAPAPTTAKHETAGRPPDRTATTSRAPAPPPESAAPPSPKAPRGPVPSIVVSPSIVPSALVPVVPVPPPSPPSPHEVPGPVVAGDPCAPEGAAAHTADGLLVRCARTWHHRLRWKIV
jgi:hypothetical protein